MFLYSLQATETYLESSRTKIYDGLFFGNSKSLTIFVKTFHLRLQAAVSWKFGHCSARASLKIWIITHEQLFDEKEKFSVEAS